ncbi:MAG TPA: phytanoyl-CoA dioxygenase family protein [Planctomycetaceae bacterium]|nr:phytanoyl-CoA dioxygenase family protein [Planctomycetaceae bacterium]
MPPKTEFKVIPGQEALQNIDRDLKFHPCTNRQPKTLTLDQIEFFNREGYLKGLRVFSPAEITRIREYFDGLLARVIAAGGDSYSISTAHLKYGPVYDILTNPKIIAYVTDLLGSDVVGWGSHFFCKMPHDGKRVSWHQDASYWPLTPSKTVTVWLAIDDADAGNACMRYIPRSHHFGHLTYHLSETTENNILDQTVENAEQFGEPIDVALKAGEISIHNDMLLHGSEANESDRRRCGLTLRFCAAEVRAHMDWNQKGVVVSGTDPSGHWANPPRPTTE